MAPKLYLTYLSPPVRAVLLTAEMLGLKLDIQEMNLLNGDARTPEFIKLNPQHTVPTLEDDGLVVWDSHAICAYLVSVYGKNDALYPKDPKKRAIIDQRLHFDSGNLFPNLRGVFFPVIMLGEKTISEDRIKGIKEALGFLEEFLKTSEWLAGSSVTIADTCTITTVLALGEIVPIDDNHYPHIKKWMKKCETLPGFNEKVMKHHQELSILFKSKLNEK